jgi:hypothetical protein
VAKVSKIHPRLIGTYDRAYAEAHAAALESFRGATAGQLRQARDELEVNPGKLTVRNRATLRGQQAAIDALIEQIALGTAGAQ